MTYQCLIGHNEKIKEEGKKVEKWDYYFVTFRRGATPIEEQARGHGCRRETKLFTAKNMTDAKVTAKNIATQNSWKLDDVYTLDKWNALSREQGQPEIHP